MDKKLENAINEQITKELYSSYLYLAMSAYFESKNLPGMSHWMQMQAQEEILHAMKFFTYMNDTGARVKLGAIDEPPVEFKSVKDVFQETLAHEKIVTASINNLYSIAKEKNDNASMILLQWFITEQVEEEKNPTDILAQLEFIKADSYGLLLLDKELAARPQPAIAPAA